MEQGDDAYAVVNDSMKCLTGDGLGGMTGILDSRGGSVLERLGNGGDAGGGTQASHLIWNWGC